MVATWIPDSVFGASGMMALCVAAGSHARLSDPRPWRKTAAPRTGGVIMKAYEIVSAEGIGAEAGSVDVVDIEKRAIVAHADVGKQAGGIAFWKMEAR